jgi:hypothetical protein
MIVEGPPKRRLQFSLVSLFALTTVTCLLLGWWAWPRPVEVVALLHAPAATPALGKLSLRANEFVVDIQRELLSALNDPTLMDDTVSIVGNGKLRIFRGRSNPAAWLRDRLEIDVLPKSIVSIKLTVPAEFKTDAIECLDYMALRAATRVNVEAARQAMKAKQPLPSFLADTPRILQSAAVSKPR